MISRTIVCLSISALVGGDVSHATTIALVPEYGARGSMQICVGRVGIRVDVDGAVHVAGPVLRIVNDRYLIAVMASTIPTGNPGFTPKMIRLGKNLRAYRYTGPSPEGKKAAPQALGDDAVRYLVEDGAGTALQVGGTSFDGSKKDVVLLSRFHEVSAEEGECIRPLGFASGQSDYRAAGFASYAEGRDAALYPPSPDRGPFYHCMGGIGFQVEAGETLRRPWRPLGPGVSWLTGGLARIEIAGPRQAMERVDPENAAEHPMSLLHESRIIYYPSRGVGPPYAPPGVTETGSWHVELGKERNSRLEIAFPAGEASRAGFDFLERLKFADDADPRCKTVVAEK